MDLIADTPMARLLNASLIAGPLAYLFLDVTYVARGVWDADTGAVHILVAALMGLTALRLVTVVEGVWQPVLLVIALLGVVGDAGVGVDTLAVGLGGLDLFHADGPANLFKTMGFFHPLTFLVAAVAVRRPVPTWARGLLAAAAVAFPIGHVANLGWLMITVGVALVVALGAVYAAVRTAPRRLDARPAAA